MSDRIVSAVFDNNQEAERAFSELRSAGFDESSISIIGQAGARSGEDIGDDGDDDVNKSGALKGALGGAAAGTLLGVAALAIPGVGPLAAAGAIAASAIPEAAAIGAAVGATAGGVAGLLSKEGVSDDDAKYYEERLHNGGTVIAVHGSESGASLEEAREILFRNGGHSASRARTDAL
jgi:uncharacterized membrane protein